MCNKIRKKLSKNRKVLPSQLLLLQSRAITSTTLDSTREDSERERGESSESDQLHNKMKNKEQTRVTGDGDDQNGTTTQTTPELHLEPESDLGEYCCKKGCQKDSLLSNFSSNNDHQRQCQMSLAEKVKHLVESGDKFFSLEFCPPKSEKDAANLLGTWIKMREGRPLFSDVTWHQGGDPGGHSVTSSMKTAENALNSAGLNVMLHMICAGQSKAEVNRNLHKAKLCGIRNILALRGDKPEGSL